MKEWMVKLKGHQEDLSRLSVLLSSSTAHIVEENDNYYLKSAEFNALEDHVDVLAAAKNLIEVINAYAMIDFGDFEAVQTDDTVISIADDGKKDRVRFHGLTLRFLPSTTRIDFQVDAWISLAKQNREIADALHFYCERNWFNFWKAYEIVRDGVGGERILIKQGWTTKEELNRFTQTAQSRAVLGDAARHASKKYRPPSKPMNLPEAKTFIEKILLHWLQSL